MARINSRRQFLRKLGLGAGALPFVLNLPSLGAADAARRKQRLVVVFSPNGVVPNTFWPDEEGDQFTLKESLQPLESFRDRTLILHGLGDRVRGDGDSHMRGIGCLLTGIELFPGNIQGGSDTPAGWASGLSIDQEIKNFLQRDPVTQTRFGSLEYGVMVPDRADTWTRMVYAGPNQPIAPIDDPYQMFAKLYGQQRDRAALGSVLDDIAEDLRAISEAVPAEDRALLEQQTTLVREMERELQAAAAAKAGHLTPQLEPGVDEENDNMPTLSRMQIELLVSSFANDQARIATLQYTHSVGGAKMTWLGVDEGHHALSHEPDSNEQAQRQLTQINRWFCEQLAHLAQRLAETPEPGGDGSLLDHTLIVWTNELGQGNSHTLENIPLVLVGGAPGFRMGRSLKLNGQPHNRLLLSLAQSFGHELSQFGNPNFCGDGALSLG